MTASTQGTASSEVLLRPKPKIDVKRLCVCDILEDQRSPVASPSFSEGMQKLAQAVEDNSSRGLELYSCAARPEKGACGPVKIGEDIERPSLAKS